MRNKGITLISLVVTIVVLLILAGVSISGVLGNNGIINKANEAAKKTFDSEVSEKLLTLQVPYTEMERHKWIFNIFNK